MRSEDPSQAALEEWSSSSSRCQRSGEDTQRGQGFRSAAALPPLRGVWACRVAAEKSVREAREQQREGDAGREQAQEGDEGGGGRDRETTEGAKSPSGRASSSIPASSPVSPSSSCAEQGKRRSEASRNGEEGAGGDSASASSQRETGGADAEDTQQSSDAAGGAGRMTLAAGRGGEQGTGEEVVSAEGASTQDVLCEEGATGTGHSGGGTANIFDTRVPSACAVKGDTEISPPSSLFAASSGGRSSCLCASADSTHFASSSTCSACSLGLSTFAPSSSAPSCAPSLPSPALAPLTGSPSVPASRSSPPAASPISSPSASSPPSNTPTGFRNGDDKEIAKPRKMILLRRGDNRLAPFGLKREAGKDDAPSHASGITADAQGELTQGQDGKGDDGEAAAAGGCGPRVPAGAVKSLEEREREYQELRARIFSSARSRSPASSPNGAASSSFRVAPRKNLTRSHQDRFDPEFMRDLVVPPPSCTSPPRPPSYFAAVGPPFPSRGCPPAVSQAPSGFPGCGGVGGPPAGLPHCPHEFGPVQGPSPFILPGGRPFACSRPQARNLYGGSSSQGSVGLDGRHSRAGGRRDPRADMEGFQGVSPGPAVCEAAQGAVEASGDGGAAQGDGFSHPGVRGFPRFQRPPAVEAGQSGDPDYGATSQFDRQEGRNGFLFPRQDYSFAYPGVPAYPGFLPNPSALPPYAGIPIESTFAGVYVPQANPQAAGGVSPSAAGRCVIGVSAPGHFVPEDAGFPHYPFSYDAQVAMNAGAGWLYPPSAGSVSPATLDGGGRGADPAWQGRVQPFSVPLPPPLREAGVGSSPSRSFASGQEAPGPRGPRTPAFGVFADGRAASHAGGGFTRKPGAVRGARSSGSQISGVL
ncbi:hypothetical protein BESB_052720 [Besnoitia besnoiti]|uniref:SUZ domain-containing protein n=1 Tax=Besnoitia besnoiti TaxID=94643 RepID=A0A2A9MH85_BESBE|nr:hypothetical protein BESB_052720 [Besnoitia besnoiti]PFH35621.1 hypothetical protein BESB_052720 [Besnoitia besnoiti]